MRKKKRKQLEEEYQHQFQLVRSDLRKSDQMATKKEQLLDTLRCWYLQQRHSNGKFPDIPPQDEGGSRSLQLQHSSTSAAAAAAAINTAELDLTEAEAQSLSLFSTKKVKMSAVPHSLDVELNLQISSAALEFVDVQRISHR